MPRTTRSAARCQRTETLSPGNNQNGVHIIAFGSDQLSDITGNQVLGNLIGTDNVSVVL